MPPARNTPVLPAEDLYVKLAPSIYVIMASDHAIELAERTGYNQGSGVAHHRSYSDHQLPRRGRRPQISVSQDGSTHRSTLAMRRRRRPVFSAGGRRGAASRPGRTQTRQWRIGETVYSLGAPIGLNAASAMA